MLLLPSHASAVLPPRAAAVAGTLDFTIRLSSTEELFAAIPPSTESVRFALDGGTHCYTELPDNRGGSQCGDIVESVVLFTLNLTGTPAGTAILAGYNAYKTAFNLLQIALGREPTSPVGVRGAAACASACWWGARCLLLALRLGAPIRRFCWCWCGCALLAGWYEE